MSTLSVSHLEVRYGGLVGVADVSLEVKAGSVVALLGSNGAGKTTTLNAIAGLVPASAGSITWGGEATAGLPAYGVVAKGLTLSPEGWRLFLGQTVEQNLRLGASTLADKARLPARLERVFALFPGPAEQSVPLALEIAQYAYVLQTGCNVLEGPAARLAADPQGRKIYLGVKGL